MRTLSFIGFILCVVFYGTSTFAGSLSEVTDQAAKYFVTQAVRIENNQKLHILNIVDYSSKVQTREGKKIETELYISLDKLHPDFKLFLGDAEGAENEIYLDGSYEQLPSETIIRLRVFKKGEVLSQFKGSFVQEQKHRQSLVAVLDLEAESLPEAQRRAYSEIFRSALSNLKMFQMVSPADVDRMNPDAIQRATGCSRDQCATIVGEQLGVDRSISTTLFQIDEDQYIISGKILDVKDGSILTVQSMQHNGSLKNFNETLEKFARKLTSKGFHSQEQPKEIQDNRRTGLWQEISFAISPQVNGFHTTSVNGKHHPSADVFSFTSLSYRASFGGDFSYGIGVLDIKLNAFFDPINITPMPTDYSFYFNIQYLIIGYQLTESLQVGFKSGTGSVNVNAWVSSPQSSASMNGLMVVLNVNSNFNIALHQDSLDAMLSIYDGASAYIPVHLKTNILYLSLSYVF